MGILNKKLQNQQTLQNQIKDVLILQKSKRNP